MRQLLKSLYFVVAWELQKLGGKLQICGNLKINPGKDVNQISTNHVINAITCGIDKKYLLCEYLFYFSLASTPLLCDLGWAFKLLLISSFWKKQESIPHKKVKKQYSISLFKNIIVWSKIL